MNEIRGVLRNKLRERPFDLYTAVVIFLAGAYAILSPDWPEKTHEPNAQVLINLVSVYMIIASSFVISSLLCNRSKRPIYSIMAEMWGWLAISAASFSITLMYIAQMIYQGVTQVPVAIILGIIWFGMSIASGIRSLDIFLALKGLR